MDDVGWNMLQLSDRLQPHEQQTRNFTADGVTQPVAPPKIPGGQY